MGNKPTARIPIWKREVSPKPVSVAEESERPHRQRAVNWLPAAAFVLLASWFCISRIFHFPHPPVGLYIGVLAFVAGIVTVWAPEHPWAKAAWLLVFGGFLVLEISTLYLQRAEDQTTAETNRRNEDDRIAKILAQNEQEFSATLSRLTDVSVLAKRSINNITGGDGFCYIIFEQRSLEERRPIPWVSAIGNYPIYDIQVRITDVDNPGRSPYFADSFASDRIVPIGNLSRGGGILMPAYAFDLKDKTSYGLNLFFSARNGFWMEELRGTMVNGKWTYAYRVLSGATYNKQIRIEVDVNYPHQADGSVKW
jgi:hypothetical protein